MNSCLYECDVMHRRLEPKVHHFEYRIFMMSLDLDELDTLHAALPFFSRNRWNLFSFLDRDHLDFGKPTTRENVTAFLAQHGIQLPTDARITLVTLPRVLGYIFNPVSFYFIHTHDGSPLHAVAQVGNTFGEMKPYLIPAPDPDGVFRLTVPKHFYVSPFSALDVCFDFKLRVPGPHLDIHIDDLADGRRVLLSALTGRREELTSARLLWFALKYPLLTVKVITLIHWHALLLWWKKIPWHRKAADATLQRDVLKPHPSISNKTP